MNTLEAIQALKEGKKVRKLNWSKDIYLYRHKNNKYDDVLWNDNAMYMYNINGKTLFSDNDEWELYEEPINLVDGNVYVEKVCGVSLTRFVLCNIKNTGLWTLIPKNVPSGNAVSIIIRNSEEMKSVIKNHYELILQ